MDWVYQFPNNIHSSPHNLFFHHETDDTPTAFDMNYTYSPSSSSISNPSSNWSLLLPSLSSLNDSNKNVISTVNDNASSTSLEYNIKLYDISSCSPSLTSFCNDIKSNDIASGTILAKDTNQLTLKSFISADEMEFYNREKNVNRQNKSYDKVNCVDDSDFIMKSIEKGYDYHIPLPKDGISIQLRSNMLYFDFTTINSSSSSLHTKTDKNNEKIKRKDHIGVNILLDSKLKGQYFSYLPSPFNDCILSLYVDTGIDGNHKITSITLHKLISKRCFDNKSQLNNIGDNLSSLSTLDNNHNVTYESYSLIGQSVYTTTVASINRQDQVLINNIRNIQRKHTYIESAKVFRIPKTQVTKARLKIVASDLKLIKKQIKVRKKLMKQLKSAGKRRVKILEAAGQKQQAKSLKKSIKQTEKTIKKRYELQIKKPLKGMIIAYKKLKKLKELLDIERKKGGTVDEFTTTRPSTVSRRDRVPQPSTTPPQLPPRSTGTSSLPPPPLPQRSSTGVSTTRPARRIAVDKPPPIPPREPVSSSLTLENEKEIINDNKEKKENKSINFKMENMIFNRYAINSLINKEYHRRINEYDQQSQELYNVIKNRNVKQY